MFDLLIKRIGRKHQNRRNLSVNIESVFSKNLGINRLTGSSLKKSVTDYNYRLSDSEKRRINREIAHQVIKTIKDTGNQKKHDDIGNTPSLRETNVLAINHAGPLDVTLKWETDPNGNLNLTKYHVDSGGDQINVSKVFSQFNRNIALVALTGKKEGEITSEWKRNFLTGRIIPALIPFSEEDQAVQIYNIVDGEQFPAMHGWVDELSSKTIGNINKKALEVLEEMFKGTPNNVWMILSAGGPIRYNGALAYYASLVKHVKETYQDKIELLIDFKYMSSPEEAMSVLEVPRKTPQDIIKPNIEEFIQVLISSGLAKTGTLDINTITEEDIKTYAIKLRHKYNLLGVLVSMDKDGLMLVMQDRIIREKGITIKLACPTAAGDSLKAGFVYALSNGKSFEEAVHTGNLFGASTASMDGSQTVTPEQLAKTEALSRAQNVTPEVERLTAKN